MQKIKQHGIGLFLGIVCGLLPALSMTSSVYGAGAEARADTEVETLTLGYFPLISAVTLFKRFAPLRDYLSESLERPVILQTAKDFPTFLERTDERAYDIVVTAPHFAVKAADSGKYRIRVTMIEDVQQLVVVREDSQIRDITELAGKRISTPPRHALMTMMGVQHMIDSGLSGDRAPIYREFTSHNAANEALLANEVDAAIASSNIIRKSIKQGNPLRIISRGLQLPNMATMVAADLDQEIGDRVVDILIGMKESKKGREVLRQIMFTGFRAVTAADYEAARPYMRQGVADLKRNHKEL